MNQKQPLTIEIVSDVLCPWCFIGLRRLEQAIAIVRNERPDFQYAMRWWPFFLNPDTPPDGEPYLPFLIEKFGGRERVQGIFQRVREAGALDRNGAVRHSSFHVRDRADSAGGGTEKAAVVQVGK